MTAEKTGAGIPVRVLILPKYEAGGLDSGLPGEAQFYYDHYLRGSESYEIAGGAEGSRLYLRDGVALYILGVGKVNAALSAMAVLSDRRFDFSGCRILSTGCAGSAAGFSVMGDVFVVTAAVDYDLGHHADIREMADKTAPTWFHDPDFDRIAAVKLNPELADRAYRLVKDLPMETTERTRAFMRASFGGAEWAVREPRVLRGTAVTSDNYWKGRYSHENAVRMAETYGCPDPYAVSEMEDVAVCTAVKRMGMLDRLIVLRGSVNMDVFMAGATPESLWGRKDPGHSLATEDSAEAADLFVTGMRNTFAAGRVIVDAVLEGKI